MQLFGTLSAEQFFSSYWQKQPLLIRKALPNFVSPIDANELAGLACEEDIESRLVLETGGDWPWQVLSGPFEEESLRGLGNSHWSLSVQGIERILPSISALLESFSFLPTWLFDDVLVSYAPENGSVGAHIDNYDVFIVQGPGSRRWLLADSPQWDEEYQEDLDIRLLKSFSPKHDWVLECGDVLYIPRRFAHHGIAIGECLNYSIGFRAPSDIELLQSFSSWCQESGIDETFMPLVISEPQQSPGEIPQATIDAAKVLIKGLVDSPSFYQFFGQHITDPKSYFPAREESERLSASELRDSVMDEKGIVVLEGVKSSWINSQTPALFLEGEEIPLRADNLVGLLQHFCDTSVLTYSDMQKFGADNNGNWQAFSSLYNQGIVQLQPSVTA